MRTAHGHGWEALRRGLIAAGGLLVASTGAMAQSASRPGAGADGTIIGTGSGGPALGSTAVDTSQGGVGGTGMGKMPVQTDQLGTGQSVKGPAGQGLTSSTDSPNKTP